MFKEFIYTIISGIVIIFIALAIVFLITVSLGSTYQAVFMNNWNAFIIFHSAASVVFLAILALYFAINKEEVMAKIKTRRERALKLEQAYKDFDEIFKKARKDAKISSQN